MIKCHTEKEIISLVSVLVCFFLNYFKYKSIIVIMQENKKPQTVHTT